MNQQTHRLLKVSSNFKNEAYNSQEQHLLDNKFIFTIGHSEVNDFVIKCFDLPTYFEIDCFSLLMPNSQKQFSDEFCQVLNSFDLDQNIIDKIGQFIIVDKQNIKIKNISGQKGYLSLINITNNCQNQVLIKNNTYIIGQKSKLIVRQDNQIFGDFLDRQDLFEFTQKVRIIGLTTGTQKLFDQSFEKTINGSQFQKEILESEELKNEFIQLRLKNCIYLEVNEDKDINKYLLVENQENYFRLGRNQSSDIKFRSGSVSNRHGVIKYMDKKWIINDGQINDGGQELTSSTYGTWLQMHPNESYDLDTEQIVKHEGIELIISWDVNR